MTSWIHVATQAFEKTVHHNIKLCVKRPTLPNAILSLIFTYWAKKMENTLSGRNFSMAEDPMWWLKFQRRCCHARDCSWLVCPVSREVETPMGKEHTGRRTSMQGHLKMTSRQTPELCPPIRYIFQNLKL